MKSHGMYAIGEEVPIYKNGGVIPSISEINELINSLIEFTSNHDQNDIEEYNTSLLNSINQCPVFSKQITMPKSGYIYLILGENGRYKIGMSKHPKKRVNYLSLASCEKHTLVTYYKTDDMIGEEKRLHDIFSDKRLHSEWFDLSKSDVSIICNMSKGENNGN